MGNEHNRLSGRRFRHAVLAVGTCLSAIMLVIKCVRKAGCTCIRNERADSEASAAGSEVAGGQIDGWFRG
nr:hypothetical protein Ade03nite_17240 [Actinoplanes derwentensis]